MKVIIIYQVKIFWVGLNLEDRMNFFLRGRIEMIKMAAISPITPPNLLGMERKIAYANRKYHSGWM
jgi:hypothetical protein